MDYLQLLEEKVNEYSLSITRQERKKIGQFFTAKEDAMYIASLFDLSISKHEISILDPGAGFGILSLALLQRIELEAPHIHAVHIVCYETSEVHAHLESIYSLVSSNTSVKMTYTIKKEDYILSQPFETSLFVNTFEEYDFIVSNPPYKKVMKSSDECVHMQSVCHGAPNLYFLFMSMSVMNLRDNHEMVYIVPRSWTSGAYFKAFRKFFLSHMSIDHMHVYRSRNSVFKKDAVLQETMIIKCSKKKQKSKITISTSAGSAADSKVTSFNVDSNDVIDPESLYVYLPESKEEVEVLHSIRKFNNRLSTIGFKMKTGLVVDFRCREYLLDKETNDSIPLLYSQNIGKDGEIKFPAKESGQYLKTNRSGLIQNNTNYLLFKRFTSKEEKRRLQIGVYEATTFANYKFISTQNKLNFICRLKGDMTMEELYGLYVVFNSEIYDRYYRILNGSTQVNSTEINNIPIPSIEQICELGKKILITKTFDSKYCESLLKSIL